uniref:CSON006923 protein n=1 Tax=Culicoides sonorensis TaxID=179676 RepID=A0A336LA76_CULSO
MCSKSILVSILIVMGFFFIDFHSTEAKPIFDTDFGASLDRIFWNFFQLPSFFQSNTNFSLSIQGPCENCTLNLSFSTNASDDNDDMVR